MTPVNLVAKVASISVSVGLLGCEFWLMSMGAAMATPRRTAAQDRQVLIALENDWLRSEHRQYE